jgi:superfamily II DNA/RNA helicase
MVWRSGVLPQGSPNLGPLLTPELLAHGFGLLRIALKAREMDVPNQNLSRAFEQAAESLESVVRNGDPIDESRGFYRVVAAASYHLGRFSARAYSLLERGVQSQNLSVNERALSFLILRRLDDLYSLILEEVTNPERSDARVANRLTDEEDPLDLDDALVLSATENYLRALAAFIFALRTGDSTALAASQERLSDGEELCFHVGLISIWWIYRITRFLTDDLWRLSIQRLLPLDSGDESDWSRLREVFVASLAERSTAELDLWPSQLEAASRVLDVNDDIVASLPTSSGKTRIAELCILRTLSLGRRVVFVTPLRSLSAQTERTLKRTFSPLGFEVSSLYGSAGASSFDLDSLANRQIVVSTPEKLDFALRNDPSLLNDVGLIVLDEGHMLGASEREVRYEVLIQRLLRRDDASARRIVCLSAMLPAGEEMDDFVAWLRNDDPGGPISSEWRPTRQRFGEIVWSGSSAKYELTIEDKTKTFIPRFVESQEKSGPRGGITRFPDNQNDLVLASAWRLVAEGYSVLIYCPQRNSVNAVSKRLLAAHRNEFLGGLAGFDKATVANALSVGEEWLGPEHPAVRCLSLGVAIHHAALPRPYLREIDGLIREKRVQIVVASPTLSRGLNIFASCVLFQSCIRFDASKGKQALISAEEFSNVAGRAGRAYVDLEGQVLGVCFANDHKTRWRSLVSQQPARELESGLISVMFPLLRELKKRLHGPTDIVEYVLNNSSVWDDPITNESEVTEWKSALATLDIALLSLVGDEDCGPDDVAVILDKVLESSFLRRRLQRKTERERQVVSAVLGARARHICATTSILQRRGYFFSGVGLFAGRFLDDNAQELNSALLNADEAIRNGESERCIASLLIIAEMVFEIDPFRPNTFPDDWKVITAGWLNGKAMAELHAISDDASQFIEDAMVYRLAWAIEAIRVRSRANEESLFDDKPSPVVGAIETGTVSIPQSVLLQAGLSSRIAAIRAVDDCPGHFEDIRHMRAWLFSKDVVRATASDHWPTAESRAAWLDFVGSQHGPHQTKWGVQEKDITAVFTVGTQPCVPGTPILVCQSVGGRRMKVFDSEMFEIGQAGSSSYRPETPWAFGRIMDERTIRLRYLGPSLSDAQAGDIVVL